MVALVILPLERPLDLIGVSNGALDPDLLVTIPGGGRLHHLAARAWLSLVRCAHEAGWDLTYTGGGTYRTLTQQEWLFRSRYVVGGTEGGCKLWNGAMWCKKLVNGKVPASAATPGTSNHGLALAVDAALDTDPGDGVSPDDAENITPALTWLSEHAPRFGFSWEGPADNIEPWHIRYVTGDHVPQAVIDWEPHPEPPPPEPPPEDEMTPIHLASQTKGEWLWVPGHQPQPLKSATERDDILAVLNITAGVQVSDAQLVGLFGEKPG